MKDKKVCRFYKKSCLNALKKFGEVGCAWEDDESGARCPAREELNRDVKYVSE